jgi:hypothetical protein
MILERVGPEVSVLLTANSFTMSPRARQHGWTGSYEAFFYAVDFGRAALVDYIVQNNPMIDPAAQNNRAVMRATMLGHTNIVATLLKCPRVDPFAMHHGETHFSVHFFVATLALCVSSLLTTGIPFLRKM